MNRYPIMKTICIESNNPKQLSEEVNKFIEENETKTLDTKEISWHQIDFGGRITFFAYIIYYA